MKKLLAALVLTLASAVAFALPKPSQIEDALFAKDYNSARSMTEQVLRERPESAKAHLFNAYILVKTGNKQAAAVELQTAQRLDKKGDVKASALFGRTAALLEAPVAPQKAVQQAYKPANVITPTVTYKEPVAAPVKPETSAFWTFIKWVFWLGVIGAILYLLWRLLNPAPKGYRSYDSGSIGTRSTDDAASSAFYSRTPAAYDEPRVRSSSSAFSAPYTGGSTSRNLHQPVEVHHHHNNGNNGGSGFGSNLAATAGGVVAGNVISDMLLHRSHGHSHSSHSSHSAAAHDTPSPRYSEPEPAVDYSTSRSSFSSSSSRDSGDDWGRSSSSSSSSDSWGSSSSSSSSSDSWGSSDSGSSGGDW